jgi:hypothetical protein
VIATAIPRTLLQSIDKASDATKWVVPCQVAEKDRTSDYRRAAEVALEQLNWCVGYLHRIRKHSVARRLAQNRAVILRRMRRAAQ